MRFQSLGKLYNAYWYSYSDEPITYKDRSTPRLCDPSFLLPEDSPDGLWHLFAHTWIGIEHFTSTSGLDWKREHRLFLRSHSPFVFKEGNTYYLLYEKRDSLPFSKDKDKSENSRIMITSSTDLALWSAPKVLLDSDRILKAVFRGGVRRISRPNLIRWGNKYRLYFGAGETRIYDTRQKATPYLMYGEADYIDGPYEINEEPIFQIESDGIRRNLAVGSFRIIPCSDGIAALECEYSYDRDRDRSTTSLVLLSSSDGIHFSNEKTIERTPEKGWANRYISSVDIHYKESEDTWYCYYSANSIQRIAFFSYVYESIGLLLGKDEI